MSIKAMLQQGIQHHQAGRLDAAEKLYQKVLLNNSDQPEALQLLGTLFSQRGDHQKAIQYLQRSLQVKHDQPLTHYNLANIFITLRQYPQAKASLDAAISLKPNYDKAYFMRGNALAEMKQYESAVEDFAKAADYNLLEAQLYNNWAVCLTELHRDEEASETYRRGIELFPDHAMMLKNYAIILRQEGKFDEAAQLLCRALVAQPGLVDGYYNLSLVKKAGCSDAHLATIEQILRRPDLPQAARAQLHFTLAKSWVDREQPEKAAQHYHEANRLQRACYQYDAEETERYFEAIIDYFQSHDVAALPRAEQSDAASQPLFIIGMPRSGTTLTEQIMCSHSQVSAGGELPYLTEILQLPRATPDAVSFADYADALDSAALGAMADAYRAKLATHGDTSFITDKQPYNFLYIGLILQMFPQAKIICCEREARANCWSIYARLFANPNPYAYNQKELGRFYGAHHRMMEAYRALFPERIYTLSYEKLVSEPDEQIAALLAYCGLPFEEQCLRFYETKRHVRTASANQVRQPLYKDALESWRPYAPYLGELFEALGMPAEEVA